MDGRWNPGRPDMPRRLRAALGRVGARTRTPAAVLTTVGVVAAVLVVAIVLALTSTAPTPPENGTAAAAAGTPTATALPVSTSDVPASPAASPSATSDSPSPTETGGGGEGAEQPGGGTGTDTGGDTHTSDPEPAPAPTTKKPVATYAPSRPTQFGAWWASEGHYTAKWEAPEDDGNLPITGYVVKKCSGTVLARVGGGTYRVTIAHPSLECVTVQAVNAKGEGQTAQFTIA